MLGGCKLARSAIIHFFTITEHKKLHWVGGEGVSFPNWGIYPPKNITYPIPVCWGRLSTLSETVLECRWTKTVCHSSSLNTVDPLPPELTASLPPTTSPLPPVAGWPPTRRICNIQLMVMKTILGVDNILMWTDIINIFVQSSDMINIFVQCSH